MLSSFSYVQLLNVYEHLLKVKRILRIFVLLWLARNWWVCCLWLTSKLKYTLFDWWAIRLRHTCHKQSIVQAMVQRIKKLRNLWEDWFTVSACELPAPYLLMRPRCGVVLMVLNSSSNFRTTFETSGSTFHSYSWVQFAAIKGTVWTRFLRPFCSYCLSRKCFVCNNIGNGHVDVNVSTGVKCSQHKM